ncbi:hypothetical protein BH23GEM5_BH23GEM5_20700 [soil metagenome]
MTWLAAAIAHEICIRYAPNRQFKVMWLSTRRKLQELSDYRHFRQRDEYQLMRKRTMKCHPLVAYDLLHLANCPSVKEFLVGIYDYRSQQRKAAATAANGEVEPDGWKVVE